MAYLIKNICFSYFCTPSSSSSCHQRGWDLPLMVFSPMTSLPNNKKVDFSGIHKYGSLKNSHIGCYNLSRMYILQDFWRTELNNIHLQSIKESVFIFSQDVLFKYLFHWWDHLLRSEKTQYISSLIWVCWYFGSTPWRSPLHARWASRKW